MKRLLRLESSRAGALAVIWTLAFSLNVAGQAPSSNTTRSGVTGPASSLIGHTEAQVRSELGPPSLTQGVSWHFDSAVGTLTLYFKNGVVSEVNPPDFELGVLAARTAAERAAFVDALRAKVDAERKRKEAEAFAARLKADTEAKAARAKAEADAVAARAKTVADREAERKREEAKPLVRITEARARALLISAAKKANNDVETFDKLAMLELGPVAPDFESAITFVESSDEIDIVISGPLGRLYADISARVRKFEPLVPTAGWAAEAHISVLPDQINSPDIEKIIVQRNGKIVQPLRTTLVPRQMVTAIGAKTLIHSGVLVYPLSAFEPGAGVTVTIIAVPASGSNITRTFDSIELRAIQ
jgi:hypothetical protein